jgi:hypothetical protein
MWHFAYSTTAKAAKEQRIINATTGEWCFIKARRMTNWTAKSVICHVINNQPTTTALYSFTDFTRTAKNAITKHKTLFVPLGDAFAYKCTFRDVVLVWKLDKVERRVYCVVQSTRDVVVDMRADTDSWNTTGTIQVHLSVLNQNLAEGDERDWLAFLLLSSLSMPSVLVFTQGQSEDIR